MKLLSAILISFVRGFSRLFLPAPMKVYAFGGNPANDGSFIAVAPMPNQVFATAGPTTGYNQGTLITCPNYAGAKIKVSDIDISAYQVAIDATDAVTIVLTVVSAAGAAVSTLATGISIKSTAFGNKASLNIYKGAVELSAGQSIEWVVTATTPDTAGFGYTLSALCQMGQRSGQ